MHYRFLFVLITLLALPLMVTAQDNFISEQRLDAPELSALGSYAVGVQTLELVNPDQLDFLNAAEDGTVPTYDRPLTVEVWYPAVVEDADALGEYVVNARDASIQVTLTGIAIRDAEPDAMSAPYPLVVMSHGYPGNRFLLSHLGENLASKGFVVVSIDHTDSTYADQGAFASTLYNRPLDQHFVIDALIELSADDSNFLFNMVDADNVGLIGYSMGGYGAVIATGGGVTDASTQYGFAPPNGLLADHQADSEAYQALLADSRIKAVVAFAPWGYNTGFWDADGLSGVDVPYFFIAGDQDDVSGYENGTRAIWENTTNTDRYLLTYENARHNAGAPIPPPSEVSEFGVYMHYADNVWDSTRMNNIAQHFVTAFLGMHLQGEDYGAYLDLIPNGVEGVYATDDDGNFTEDHTYWLGFQDRTAVGLTLEYLESDN
ncbi:MAG: alpha/beta hydrolase family protein [Anaerolineae bacterium]